MTKDDLKEMIRNEIFSLRKKTREERAQDELDRLKKMMGKESGKDTDIVWKNHLRDKIDIQGSWQDYQSTHKWKAKDPQALDTFKQKLLEVVEEELSRLK